MYKATRLLIDERQKHSKYKLENIAVKIVPIGEPNKCHHNTFEFQKKDVLKTGCQRSIPVSGWLVENTIKQKMRQKLFSIGGISILLLSSTLIQLLLLTALNMVSASTLQTLKFPCGGMIITKR